MEVLACDEGTVIKAGDNGDHGISVTIKHSWGTSIYAHPQSFGVPTNPEEKVQVLWGQFQPKGNPAKQARKSDHLLIIYRSLFLVVC